VLKVVSSFYSCIGFVMFLFYVNNLNVCICRVVATTVSRAFLLANVVATVHTHSILVKLFVSWKQQK
jgi:hypothetical protein